MSQETFELMALAIEALNARNVEAVDALFDDAVEWRPALSAEGAVERTVYRGKEGMRKYLEDVDSGFDEMRFEVDELEAVGSDRVFYRGRVIAQGTAGGIPLDVPLWGLWQFRGGKLFRGAAFLSEREALEAAGVRE